MRNSGIAIRQTDNAAEFAFRWTFKGSYQLESNDIAVKSD
jgi:hypothetical protein